jgi:hypothetical protein
MVLLDVFMFHQGFPALGSANFCIQKHQQKFPFQEEKWYMLLEAIKIYENWRGYSGVCC